MKYFLNNLSSQFFFNLGSSQVLKPDTLIFKWAKLKWSKRDNYRYINI